jgi:hypothetical protein
VAAGFAKQVKRLFRGFALFGERFLRRELFDEHNSFFVKDVAPGEVNGPVEMEWIGAHRRKITGRSSGGNS